MASTDSQVTLYTVGHSNTPADVLLTILSNAGIKTLCDIRRYPASRRNPQFNADRLAASLADIGIDYRHFEALGGRRVPDKASINTAIREEQFRGYADYMASSEWNEALSQVLALAAEAPTAVMCAESLPFKCHRSLLSDVAVARGVRVVHLIGATQREHVLASHAKVENGIVTYPALL
jgi:uncharacterized protein (DUF488 family)